MHDGHAGALQDQLAEHLVHTESVRHANGDIGVLSGRRSHHARDVARGVLSRGQHIGERNQLRRAGLDTTAHSRRDGRLGQLHVCVTHHHRAAGHGLDQVRHAVHHLVRGVAPRAMVDQQYCPHPTAPLLGP